MVDTDPLMLLWLSGVSNIGSVAGGWWGHGRKGGNTSLSTGCYKYPTCWQSHGIGKGRFVVVLPDGQRSGVTAETLKNIASRQMQIQEARKILGIEDNLPWPDIVKVKT